MGVLPQGQIQPYVEFRAWPHTLGDGWIHRYGEPEAMLEKLLIKISCIMRTLCLNVALRKTAAGPIRRLLEGGCFKEQSMASTLSSHVAGQISEDIFIPNTYVAVGAVVQTVRSTGYDA